MSDFLVDDLVTLDTPSQRRVIAVVSDRVATVSVDHPHPGSSITAPASRYSPVTASAKHVGRRARGRESMSGAPFVGVVEDVHQRGLVGLRLPDGDYAEVEGAVLVADKPIPTAGPDTSTLRGRVEQAVAGTVHVASEAAATVDAVMEVVGPDPAAGLTVTPDGQRVVDAGGGQIAARGRRTAWNLRADATRNDRVCAALRLLADHAEAAEATPTVDEDAEARAVYAAMYDMLATDWDDEGESIRQKCRQVVAAARAARTGDGA